MEGLVGRVTRREEGPEGGAAGLKRRGSTAELGRKRVQPVRALEGRSQGRGTCKGVRGYLFGGVGAERGGNWPGDP